MFIDLQETMAARKAVRQQERDALGRGEMPESLKEWKVCTVTANIDVQGCMSAGWINCRPFWDCMT